MPMDGVQDRKTDQIVLVVDDDVTSLKLATGIMEDDFRVAAATSGAMVFKYLENNTPDLILLDLNMPDMDGFEVIAKLKTNPDFAGIPVIFVTASQSQQSEVKCLEAGAVDFVSKPFIPLILKTRVRRILEISAYRRQLETLLKEKEANT